MSVPMVALGGGGAVIECGDVGTGGLTALTVEGWVRVGAISGANRPLVTKYGSGRHEWTLYVTKDGRLYFVVWTAQGSNIAYSGSGRIVPNRLNHVAGCYSGSHCKVWLNGLDVTVGTRVAGGPVANTVEPVRIGGFIGDVAVGFTGRVGWQRISDVCRLPGVVAGPEYPPGVDGHTVGQWNMSEGAGGTVANAVGDAAYDGVMTSASWATSETSDKRRAAPVSLGLFGRGFAFPAGARG